MYVPKPQIVQQSWGNSLTGAIERERQMQHEKKLMDMELEYKKSKDLIKDQQWNKEFDLNEAMATTQNDIMKQQALRLGKQNEMLTHQNEQLINQMVQNEKIEGLKGYEAKNQMAVDAHQKKIDALELQASKWGGAGWDAMQELAKLRKEGGQGSWWDGGLIDYLGGVGKNENQGLAKSLRTQDPNYVSREDFASQMIDDMGGRLTSDSYYDIMGTPWNTSNQAAAMPDQQAIDYVNQALGYGTSPHLQQMYQNQQPQDPYQRFREFHNQINQPWNVWGAYRNTR